MCKSFTFLILFFLKYFILFCYNCEWDCLLNFLIGWLVVCVYKHDWFVYSDFVSCNFSEFISSNLLFIVVECFLCIWSCHLQAEIILFSFLIGMSFISYLITPDRISSTLLNISGKNVYPCLVPDLRKEDFHSPLPTLSLILARAFHYGLYYVEVRSFSCYFVESFYQEWMINFVKWFFCIYTEYQVFLFILFCYLLCCITLTAFHMLNHPHISGINPTWSWCIILLMCCWIWFVSILLRMFASMFITDICI